MRVTATILPRIYQFSSFAKLPEKAIYVCRIKLCVCEDYLPFDEFVCIFSLIWKKRFAIINFGKNSLTKEC